MASKESKLGFTVNETRMIKLLADGKPHTKDELSRCIVDDGLVEWKAVLMTICRTRRKLQTIGQDILCVLVNRRICYRRVRLLVFQKA